MGRKSLLRVGLIGLLAVGVASCGDDGDREQGGASASGWPIGSSETPPLYSTESRSACRLQPPKRSTASAAMRTRVGVRWAMACSGQKKDSAND